MSLAASLRQRLLGAGQDHLVAIWEQLGDEERSTLLSDLESVELERLPELFRLAQQEPVAPSGGVEPLQYVEKGTDPAADAAARRAGEELLAQGRIAAFVVAGGQGTRLGHPGPKGTFPATPVAGKPLFRLFADKLRALATRAGRPVPWYVMTSPGNDAETRDFFEKHCWFGLPPASVRFLVQGTMPALDASGRLVMEEPGRLFRSPDGHGGSLKALSCSGALDEMREAGIDEIFYFQVDNPLVELCDPVFMGYHHMRQSDFSSKAVAKRDAHEKVGVFVRRAGRATVIEYSDLPDELRHARDEHGSLLFGAGSIATHALKRTFVERLNAHGFALPFHVAKKKVPSSDVRGRVEMVPGLKFETFVFDALPLADRVFLMEVRREDEFSPIKNREGDASPATSRRDQSALFAAWLEAAGVRVLREENGFPRHRIEISPRFADGREALLARREELPASVGADLLLEATETPAPGSKASASRPR